MENSILKKISKFIIDQRMLVMIVFAAACVYCAMSISKVKVNEDITVFLPANTDTRRGLTIMEEEFTTFASANVMLANTTYDLGLVLSKSIVCSLITVFLLMPGLIAYRRKPLRSSW